MQRGQNLVGIKYVYSFKQKGQMKIVISGSIAIDRIMVFDGLFENLIQPDKLHVLSISTLVEDLKETRGGTAGNIAYSLALLGENPILYGAVGRKARPYMNSLKRCGVDTSHVHFSKFATATFTVLTDKNDCQVGGFYPGAMSDADSLTVKNFEDDDILMVVSAHDPKAMVRQIAECQKMDKRLFFDIGQQILVLDKDQLRAGIEAAELMILNDYEMGLLQKKTEWSLKKITSKLRTCVVTLGGKGSMVYENKKEYQVAAVKLDKVVDPTGAGDAFRAGFLYGYVRDWKLRKCTKLGSVVASFCVEKHGTQEHSFTKRKIKNRWKKTYKG